MGDYDLPLSATRLGLAILILLMVFALVLAGLRRLAGRLDRLATKYVATMDNSVERSRVFDDLGLSGKVVGRIAFNTRHKTSIAVPVAAVLLALGISFWSGHLMAAYLLVGFLVAFPFLFSKLVDIHSIRYTAEVDRSLPDATSILSSSMCAGLTFQSALRGAAANLRGPLRTECRIASNEIATGASVAEALQHMAKRTESEYVGMLAAAAGVHVQRGGDVGAALKELGMAITRIILAEGEVRAKTAGTRREAMWVTFIPFLVLPVGLLLQPETYSQLFLTNPGVAMLVGATVLWLFSARGLHRVCNRKV